MAGVVLTNITAISAGDSFGLALKADVTVVGWRSDALRLTDTQMYAVAGISNVVAIAVGGGHGGGISLVSVGLLKDATVITWGAKTLHHDFAPPRPDSAMWLPLLPEPCIVWPLKAMER